LWLPPVAQIIAYADASPSGFFVVTLIGMLIAFVIQLAIMCLEQFESRSGRI
jgi:hypothetical protein